jgi:hypothetical protein
MTQVEVENRDKTDDPSVFEFSVSEVYAKISGIYLFIL